ncbi:MAG: RNA polymerase sigma factor [Acidimicrobiales bacterium]
MSLPPFQHIVDELGPPLRRHLAAMAGVGEADDLAQDTLIAALRAYPDLPSDANVRAWLWTIARNKVIDRYRANGRRPSTTPLDTSASPPGAVRTDPSLPDEALWGAVRALPEGQRWAVVLRFVDDLSYARIAELCDCSPGAARQRVHEALRTLRQEVDR